MTTATPMAKPSLLEHLGLRSHLVRVPDDLDQVTCVGEELPETQVGLTAGTVDALWQRIRALYATGVQPGIQLCIRHHGQVVLDRAIGHVRLNTDDGATLQCDTPVNLFSAGKAVTAMLIHKLEELGRLRIDDPVSHYIPGFDRHGKHAITIRHLLAHRAALHTIPAEGFDLDLLQQPDAVRELIKNLKPRGRVGGAPAYHAVSAGFVFAEVIRQATGEEPDALLHRYIKDPLDMRWMEFGIDASLHDTVAENAATGAMPRPLAWHMRNIVGASFRRAVKMSNDPRFLGAVIPSANVISTARDTTRLYHCLLQQGRHQGRSVFAPETVARSLSPDRSSASIDRKIGIPIRYSPGFMLGHGGLGLYGWNQRHTFGHLGLSNTLTWARRDTHTCVALLATGKPVIGPHLRQLLSVFSGLNALCENRLVKT